MYVISFPIVPNRLFLGRTKNNRHFGYPETKITDFKISGTGLGTNLHHCRLILETETEPGTKSSFHYLCPKVILPQRRDVSLMNFPKGGNDWLSFMNDRKKSLKFEDPGYFRQVIFGTMKWKTRLIFEM